MFSAPAFAQLPPQIPYDSVPDYFKYPPEMNLGEMGAVAVNSKGHVFMLSRSNVSGPAFGAAATQVLEFDEKGNYLREIGKGLYGFAYGHGIRVGLEARVFPSWNRRGGCAIKKKTASEAAQTGWSVVTKCFAMHFLQHFPQLTTPSAPFKGGFATLS
jgi:hypothetical protein